MRNFKLSTMEDRLAELIWENEPLSTRALTEICEETFNWKRTTTYTMLKRLIEKEVFENDNSTVKSLISKSDFRAKQGQVFLDESYNGSLPQFLAAFTRRKKLSSGEIKEIEKLINDYKEDL